MAKQTKRYKRREKKNYTLDEVLGALEDILESYVKPSCEFNNYHQMILNRGFYPSKMDWWRLNHPEVKGLLDELEAMQAIKINSAFLDGEGTTGLIWYTKCRLGYVAKETLMKFDNDKDVAHIGNDTIIRVGFDE